MLGVRRVLAVGAHPDDIEYGCFGLLLKLGPAVEKHIYVASLGSAGDPTSGPHRRRESEEACAVLQPASLTFRMQPGITPMDIEGVMAELFTLIDRHRPDLILTLGNKDTHQEHHYVHQAVHAAARRSHASILIYSLLSNTLDFHPTVFVDVSAELGQKKAALAAHKSQSGKYYMTDEYLEIFHSHNYATLHGLRYAEAYEVFRLFVRGVD